MMSYRVVYGDELPINAATWPGDHGGKSERFSTEFEALTRAREILNNAEAASVAVCDTAGNVLGGVCLQLKLECCTD
jgi:hypothetical protein